MATKHKPSPNLQSVLADLLTRAEKLPGTPALMILSNNLQVAIKVEGNDTFLQISRSSCFPSDTEWRTILRHWPYPVLANFNKIDTMTRKYLSGSWPTQIHMKACIDAGDKLATDLP